MSEFLKSIDRLIAAEYATDALHELSHRQACEIKNRRAVEEILETLIHRSIEHARSQENSRKCDKMSFDSAMKLVQTRSAKVTRASWSILVLVTFDEDIEDGPVVLWRLDNCDGDLGGSVGPYHPSDEDRAATDWMLYQTPEDNWIELRF